MPSYDVIMLIVLISATIFGAIKGFAWQIASLASVIVSYAVAYYFRNDVAKMINAQHPWNLFIAMLVLYAGTSFAIWMVFRLVSSSIDKVKLKEFDRHLGALFGLGKGLVFCLLITMFAMTLLGPAKQQAICASRSGYYISKFLAGADGLFPKEIDQIIRPHLDRLEQQLEQGRDGTFVSTPTNNAWNWGNSNSSNGSIIPTLPGNLNDAASLLPNLNPGNNAAVPQAPQGFAAPQSNQGFAAPQANQGFPNPQNSQGFTSPQSNQGFATPQNFTPPPGFQSPQATPNFPNWPQ